MIKVIKTSSFFFVLPISFFSFLLVSGSKVPVSTEKFKQIVTRASVDSAREHNRLILNQIEYELDKKYSH